MKLLLKLAWRNIFRNKRRTIIAGIAIGIGLTSLIYVDALFVGMKVSIIKEATASFLGQGQIHRDGYRETQEVDKTINDIDKLVNKLKNDNRIDKFTLRTFSLGMVNSPSNVRPMMLVGIDSEEEKYLSRIDDAILKGSFFKGNNQRDIIIGKKFAEILEVGVGDRIVITVSQAKTEEFSQEMFKVSGIFYFNNPEFDKGIAFIRINKAQKMLNIGNRAHEIALKFKNIDKKNIDKLSFWKEYSQDGNEALSWMKLLPQLKIVFEMTNLSIFIIGLILFAVIALVIINSLFMSIFERMFEFGVLKAVGTGAFNIAKLIILESSSLAILSIGMGIIGGFILTYIYSKTGIDYTGIEMMGVTIQNILYPVIQIRQFITYPIIVFFLTSIIGIYPAIYAAKMSPSEAMRKSL
jgi:ABC-type lipoprotein release transport system permease subunit